MYPLPRQWNSRTPTLLTLLTSKDTKYPHVRENAPRENSNETGIYILTNTKDKHIASVTVMTMGPMIPVIQITVNPGYFLS